MDRSTTPDRTARWGAALRATGGAAGSAGAALLALHLISAWALRPTTAAQSAAVTAELQAVAGAVMRSQVRLASAVFAVGAVSGAIGALAILGLRFSPKRLWLAGATLGLGGVGAAGILTLARQPALFEDLLARHSAWGAALQVLVSETVGERALRRIFAGVAVGWLAAVSIRNRRAVRLGQVLGAAVVVVGLWAWGHWSRHAVPGTPIIVLAADSLRPDHFSSEGYPRQTTPHLDALRASGVWADDEFVPIASTTASWASLLTGLYPHHTGVRDLFPRQEATRLFVPTLPGWLRAAGYQSAVVSDYAGESFRRVDLGFDQVDAPPATSVEVFAEREIIQREPVALALFSGALGHRLFPVFGYLPPNADPAALSDRAEDVLDALESDGRPYLLVVFYSVTHAPFAAPMPDAARFSSPGYTGPNRYSYSLQQLSDLAHTGERPSEAEVDQVRALYDGALVSFDEAVARIVGRLDRDGQTQRILVVTGDHGESLFEPGATTEHGKWFAGGEAANRTALIIQAPGLAPGRIPGVISGVDLAPTLLDRLGLPVPPRIDGAAVLGPATSPDRVVFAETGLWLNGPAEAPPGAMGYPPLLDLLEVEPGTGALVLKRRYVDDTITAKLRAARQGPWELIYTPTVDGAHYALFDLAHDRFGEHDLASASPLVMSGLRSALLDWMQQDPERWLDPGDRLIRRVEQ